MKAKKNTIFGNYYLMMKNRRSFITGLKSTKITSKERKFLDEDLLIHNQNRIKKQFETFLDFKKSKNKALKVNNFDWFKDFDLLRFFYRYK